MKVFNLKEDAKYSFNFHVKLLFSILMLNSIIFNYEELVPIIIYLTIYGQLLE